MARRMIHTEIWQSKQVASLSLQARLLHIGLITLADDDGRLKGDAALLRAQIFPRDADIEVKDVETWLQEIVDNKLVVRYEVDDEAYLAHPNWTKYQTLRSDRKRDSNIPQPPDGLMTTNGQPDVGQVTAEGKVGEDKKRKEKGASAQDIKNAFENFWGDYPNKTAKKKAEQIFTRILKEAKDPVLLTGEIMIGLMRAKKSSQWMKDGGQFIPHPTTWLNQERWNDEGRTDTATTKKTHRV